jgi:hypothetical protein
MEELSVAPYQSYKDIRSDLRSGDILLCSGSSVFSTLIQKATNSIWSHIAFILRLDVLDRIMVLESVESIGVRTVPLSSYIFNYNGTGKGYVGKVLVARHADVKPENIPNLSRHAIDLFGYPYSKEEVVKIATRISLNALGVPMPILELPQREFICSEYVYTCFKSIHVEIEFNAMGFVAPADFARCPKLKPLYFLKEEEDEKARNDLYRVNG